VIADEAVHHDLERERQKKGERRRDKPEKKDQRHVRPEGPHLQQRSS
jgi:hypothetical protein